MVLQQSTHACPKCPMVDLQFDVVKDLCNLQSVFLWDIHEMRVPATSKFLREWQSRGYLLTMSTCIMLWILDFCLCALWCFWLFGIIFKWYINEVGKKILQHSILRICMEDFQNFFDSSAFNARSVKNGFKVWNLENLQHNDFDIACDQFCVFGRNKSKIKIMTTKNLDFFNILWPSNHSWPLGCRITQGMAHAHDHAHRCM